MKYKILEGASRFKLERFKHCPSTFELVRIMTSYDTYLTKQEIAGSFAINKKKKKRGGNRKRDCLSNIASVDEGRLRNKILVTLVATSEIFYRDA